MKEKKDTLNMQPMFWAVYREKTGLTYYWTVKDGVAAKQLRDKLRRLMEERGQATDYDELALAEHFVRKAWEVSDAWERERFGMAMINSNYNSYLNRIMNGTSNQQPAAAGTEYKRQILADLYAGGPEG